MNEGHANMKVQVTWRRGARLGLWGLVVALACAFSGIAGAQELMLKKTLPDLVAESEWISVADLVGAQAHRNARGNLIVTDFRFRATQTLLGTSPGAEFVLSQGGGTLAGETQAISDTPDLVVGNRYLLFVRPGRGEMFPPFVGGAQGAFLLSADGKAMSLGGDRRRVVADDLLGQVSGLIAARGAAPPRIPETGLVPAGTYPAKSYLPIALAPPLGHMMQAAPDSAEAPAGPVATQTGSAAMALDAGSVPPSGPGIDYQYTHRITPPAVINGFPHDWTPWYPEDEYQMSSWNQYGGDIFHVYTTPTGDWAWGNGRFDLAGWPTNDTMIAQFGEGWGPTTLGITYRRWFGTGPIVEADTALNPAYCWTLDESAATSGDPCWGFRQTMRHELGHSWGLDHPWETQSVWWDSIMNYSPKNFRFAQLFADDANAVRAAFGGPAIHDALLSLYTTTYDGTAGAQSALYTPTQQYPISLQHGTDLSAWIGNQFKIENLGTDDVVAPTVQFFLSQQRMTWAAGYAYLGSGTYTSVPLFTTYTYWMPSLPIPATTPTGNYWLGAYLPDADANMDNNSAWADQDLTVHVDNNPTTLVPETYWQSSETGYLGPAGRWSFTFAAE
ncbi:MAG: hypothetical protein ACHP7D_07215, partial [Lysobacterales bacterium]